MEPTTAVLDINFFETKDQLPHPVREHNSQVESWFLAKGIEARRIRCDNARENISHNLKNFFPTQGITVHQSSPYAPAGSRLIFAISLVLSVGIVNHQIFSKIVKLWIYRRFPLWSLLVSFNWKLTANEGLWCILVHAESSKLKLQKLVSSYSGKKKKVLIETIRKWWFLQRTQTLFLPLGSLYFIVMWNVNTSSARIVTKMTKVAYKTESWVARSTWKNVFLSSYLK